ncbi:N-acetylmuramoyl-L-alanine amidase [Synechococcus sp. PCC 7336]|uniref:N-acetylmuramoyl-L-alanine amidase n=1 Tax=Synechococcus sp. PCC 7336 TaxID=195250 RepID=UPI000349EB9D|nr:N-acetylmuramoyl-L-alanine amidase [Synechococcus sp. PCC 7336]
MKRWRVVGVAIAILLGALIVTGRPSVADDWQIVYPPENHSTASQSIFFIGTAPARTQVTVNGQAIHRSPAGHFAPSFPLAIGSNTFTFILRPSNGAPQQFVRQVTRLNPIRSAPATVGLLSDTIQPQGDVWKQPGEVVCFEAIGTPNADVSVRLWDELVPLVADSNVTSLPVANAILTGEIEAVPVVQAGRYRGCANLPDSRAGGETSPQIVLTASGQTVTANAGLLRVLDPQATLVARANTDDAIARNGPSSSYIRYSPWPQGTQSEIVGRENDWLQTASEKWIAAAQAEIVSVPEPPRSAVGSVQLTRVGEWTELRLPLTVRLPYNVTEEPGQIVLELDGASLQTDFFRMDADDPLVTAVSWGQVSGDRIRYKLHLSRDYAWGYEATYEGTTLLLRVRHAPQTDASAPLRGLKIAIDPGHGGEIDLGARGPNGYPEKALNLSVSQRLAALLRERGAEVLMTRTADVFVPLADRADLQGDAEPHLFVSIHYNALPDSGDAENTRGIASFWYFPHSRPLAQALHLDLLRDLGQPDYGHFFSSLAVIRATSCPSVLLELGFTINPEEFELIVTPEHQQRTAEAIADSLARYVGDRT